MKPKKSEDKKPTKLYSWSSLDREHAAKRMREYVGRSPRLLEDHVNFGLAFMDVLYRDYVWQRSSNTTVAILCAFRRSLEFLDAVDVLLAAGCVTGAAAPGRAFLELVASMMYLSRVLDERAAMAFMLAWKFDEATQVEAAAAKHAPGSRPTIVAKESIQSFMEDVDANRLLSEAQRERERLKKERGDAVRWFELFGGPRTLQNLVRRLDLPGFDEVFDIMYGKLSRTVHGEDAVLVMRGDDNENKLFHPLRGPNEDEDWQMIIPAADSVFRAGVTALTGYFAGGARVGPEWWWQQRDLAARL